MKQNYAFMMLPHFINKITKLPRAHQSTALVWPAPVMISCQKVKGNGHSITENMNLAPKLRKK